MYLVIYLFIYLFIAGDEHSSGHFYLVPTMAESHINGNN